VTTMAKARLAGLLYVIIIVTAMFAEVFVRAKLVNLNDAAFTASQIVAHESLYRLGAASMLVALLCDVVVAVLLFELFRPVSWTLSALAAALRLIDVVIIAVNLLNHFEALLLIKAGEIAPAIATLRTYAYGFNLGMIFFGLNLLFLGYLIVKSSYLPRFIGVLLEIAGVAYIVNSYVLILAPAASSKVFAFMMVAPFLAEASLAVWLLAKGVNVTRYPAGETA
jgi:hypothetical protein